MEKYKLINKEKGTQDNPAVKKRKQHLPTFIKVILIILILNAAPKIVQIGFLLYDKIYDPPLLGITRCINRN